MSRQEKYRGKPGGGEDARPVELVSAAAGYLFICLLFAWLFMLAVSTWLPVGFFIQTDYLALGALLSGAVFLLMDPAGGIPTPPSGRTGYSTGTGLALIGVGLAGSFLILTAGLQLGKIRFVMAIACPVLVFLMAESLGGDTGLLDPPAPSRKAGLHTRIAAGVRRRIQPRGKAVVSGGDPVSCPEPSDTNS